MKKRSRLQCDKVTSKSQRRARRVGSFSKEFKLLERGVLVGEIYTHEGELVCTMNYGHDVTRGSAWGLFFRD